MTPRPGPLPRARSSARLRACAPLLLAGACAISGGAPARADWSASGTPVAAGADHERNPQVVTDGAGGALVLYEVLARPRRLDVTRLTARGTRADGWPAAGVTIAADSLTIEDDARVVEDGAGGGFVSWSVGRGPRARTALARHVRGDGGLSPAARFGASEVEGSPRLAPAGPGAAFLAWSRDDGAIRLVRLDDELRVAPGWPADGVPVGGSRPERLALLGADGAGGAFLLASGVGSNTLHLYRAGADGLARGWPSAGVRVADDALVDPGAFTMAPSGTGVLLVWTRPKDAGDPDDLDVVAQRFSSDGAVAAGWPDAGLVVCDRFEAQFSPVAVTDGSGGAVVVWHDASGADAGFELQAQRILASGAVAPQWPANGVPLGARADAYTSWPALVADGAGGAVAFWPDARSADAIDVVAQRIDSTGARPAEWDAGGVVVARDVGVYAAPRAAPGADGGIVVWSVTRPSGNLDVHAGRVSRDGLTGDATLVLRAPAPHRSGGAVLVFELPAAARVRLEIHDGAGARVRRLLDGEVRPGRTTIAWQGDDDWGRPMPAGDYVVTLRAGRERARRRFVLTR